MTEEYGIENLIACSESFLRTKVFNSLKDCVQVLRSCSSLLLQAEDVRLTEMCIDAIASIICSSDAQDKSVAFHDRLKHGLSQTSSTSTNWWADELLPLPINFFKQIIHVMQTRGFQAASITDALMCYAHEALKPYSLRPLETFISEHKEQGDPELPREHEKRIALEVIVGLLPAEQGSVPITFLFGLLRIGYALDTTIACQMELEKKIGAELEHATVEDLLVPSALSCTGETLFDVDFVQRLVANFVRQDAINSLSSCSDTVQKLNAFDSHSQVAVMKVAELFDSYLAEVAADPNLKVTKLISLMELLPSHARLYDDGLYRTVDIYLKAHPMIGDEDRKRICSCMDCQKLSQEARFHAAQNERLPVHVRVQVLYVEQLRLHSALSTLSGNDELIHSLRTSQRLRVASVSCIASPSRYYASLQQENEDLKTEVACMRTRLSQLEKQQPCDIHRTSCVTEKAFFVKRLLSLLSRNLRRIKPSQRGSMAVEGSESEEPPQGWEHRRRRDSVS